MWVGWGWVSGNHQGGVNSVSQVNGELRFDICLREASWVVWGLNKGTMTMPALLSLERAVLTFAPSPLALNLVNLVHSHMSLVLFELLTLHWRPEQVSLWANESVLGPYKTCNTKICSGPLSHWDANPDVFHSPILWGLLLLALWPWAERPMWGTMTICSSEGSTAEISLLVLIFQFLKKFFDLKIKSLIIWKGIIHSCL